MEERDSGPTEQTATAGGPSFDPRTSALQVQRPIAAAKRSMQCWTRGLTSSSITPTLIQQKMLVKHYLTWGA